MMDHPVSSLLPLLAVVAVVVVIVKLGWRRLGSAIGVGADFEVRHWPGQRPGTTVRGRVPASKHGAVRAFFNRDLNSSGPVTVRGSWGPAPSRPLRLEIDGPLNNRQRQQVRNFLTTLLR